MGGARERRSAGATGPAVGNGSPRAGEGTGGSPAAGMPRGRFVTFEGGEGAGKTTQIRRLAERLAQHGIDPLITREPGGSAGAEIVRHVLLSGAAEALGADAEAMLFAAARADHVDQTIRPALEAGRWVLCDRFADSMRVYQGTSGKVDVGLIDTLERVALDGVVPDLTILLDLPAEDGLARAAARRGTDVADRFEKEELAVHQVRRVAFLALARAEPRRFAVVDAAHDPATVAEDVWLAVSTRLGVR